ncbi:MAG: hypothetical protein KC492_25735, partial [Myxococcales bacterium]|nr:hypothetical protein [Myxococcales bacterium]
MVTYEQFGDEVDAHLNYAMDLPVVAAIEVFGRRLQDRTWRRAPSTWIHLFNACVYRASASAPESLRAVFSELCSQLVAGVVDTVSSEALTTLIQWPVGSGWSSQEASALATWFVARANPGDASLAADVVERAMRQRPDLELSLAPMARWLIENGAAELRSKRRAWLAVGLVGMLDRCGERALLLPAVRYVLVNDDWVRIVSMFSLPNEARALLQALDSLAEIPGTGRLLVADLLNAYEEKEGRYLAARLLQSDAEWPAFPRLKVAIFDLLVQGRVCGAVAQAAWAVALTSEPNGARHVFETRAAAVEALRALKTATVDAHRREPWLSETQEFWASTIALAVLQFEASDNVISATSSDLLLACLGHVDKEGVTNGILAALRQFCTVLDAPGSLVSALAHTSDAASGTGRALLTLLRKRPPTPRLASLRRPSFVRAVQVAVDRVLSVTPRHQYRAIADLLAGVSRMVPAELV